MSKISFYREINFKKTEIGEIPRKWGISPLKGKVKKIKAGGTPKTTIKEYYENGTIPFVKIEDLTQNGKYLTKTTLKITEKGLKNSSAWIVPINSVLLAMYGSLGEVSINKIKVATNQAILGIVPKEKKLNSEFLYYWFLKFKPNWIKYAKLTTQANLTKPIVEKIKLPIPPLEEQKNIAEVLKDFDDLLENIEKQIKTLERVKKGLMNIYFTKGVFKHETFKDTELGRIPAEWRVRKVKDLLNLRKPLIKGKKPTLEGNDLIPYVNTEYLRVDKITQYSSANNKDLAVNENDILILWDGSNAGEIFKGKYGILGSTFVRFNFIKTRNIDRNYIFYFFKARIEKILKLITQGTGIPHVDKKILLNRVVLLPPLKEQKAIAERLKTIDDQIENLKKQKDHLQKVKKKFMDLLLTGKIRVKIHS